VRKASFVYIFAMSNSLISVMVRLGWVRFGEESEFCVYFCNIEFFEFGVS
jgi:hypothetical protein